MSDWPTARAALADVVGAVDNVHTVRFVPPQATTEVPAGEIVAAIAPPGRSAARTPGRLERTYRVELSLIALVATDAEASAMMVDAAADAVSAALEQSVVLGGAVSSATSPAWSPAFATDLPAGSGMFCVVMTATLELVFISSPERSP